MIRSRTAKGSASTASEWRSGSPWKPGTATTSTRIVVSTTRPSDVRADRRSMVPIRPTRSVKPRTSRRLPAIEPTSDALTTSVSPSERAMTAMISSGAFPNVAFRKPPIPGPVWRARLSVASPISHERDQRRAGEHEQRQLAGGVAPIQKHDEWRQQQHCRSTPQAILPPALPTATSYFGRQGRRPRGVWISEDKSEVALPDGAIGARSSPVLPFAADNVGS